MRRLITLWFESAFSSFSIGIVADRIVGHVNICTAEGITNYIVFSFSYAQDWEGRLVTWIVNLLCGAVGEICPLGLNCELFPRLNCALTSSAGLGTISLVPLRLADINRVVITASVRVLGGTDVHVILNHLQSRLKPFMKDEMLLSCPNLLRVCIIGTFHLRFWSCMVMIVLDLYGSCGRGLRVGEGCFILWFVL